MAVTASPSAAQTGNYICLGDQATGFHLEKKKWIRTVFTTDRKYIIRKGKPDFEVSEKHAGLLNGWPVTRTLIQTGTQRQNICAESEITIWCEGEFSFLLHKKTGRYSIASTHGYALNLNDRDVWIEIGMCTGF